MKKIIGATATILATVAYHLIAILWLGVAMPTVAWMVPFVIWAGFSSGLWAGVVAGVWAGGYSFLLVGDVVRASLVLISLVISGAFVGYRTEQWQRAKADLKATIRAEKEARLEAQYNQEARNFVDDLNGNLEMLQETIGRINDLFRDWNDLHNDARRDRLRMIKHDLTNLMTAVDGWRQLAWIKELILPES